MDDELTVRDVETLKVIADERRLALLRLLRQPATAKELAAKLNEPVARLYYHLNLLEQHQLIRVVATNLVSGIVEKRYQASARNLRLFNPMIAGPAISDQESVALFSALIDETRHELQRAAAKRPPRTSATPPHDLFLTKKALQLTPSQVDHLHHLLTSWITAVDQLDQLDQPAAASSPFRLTVAFYRYEEEEPRDDPSPK